MSFLLSQNNNSDLIQTSLLINEFHLPVTPSSDANGQTGNRDFENNIPTHQFLNEISQYFTGNSPANEDDRTIQGTSEDDRLNGNGEHNLIFGNQEDDFLSGDDGNDSIYGGQNDDFLSGNAGHDLISGENGNDWIFGNEGRDIARGGEGDDSIYGGRDNDLLFGNNGDDSISGDDGNDLIFGNQGKDSIRGGQGHDLIHGGQDDDLLSGENGDDILYGEASNDFAFGGQGNDSISGGNGNDALYGGRGEDVLDGGQGNDLIVGGQGNDYLTGGFGEDTFRFEFFATSEGDTLASLSNENGLLGTDTITDFNASEDRIELDSRLFPALDDTLKAAFSTVDQIDNLGAGNAAIVYESNTGSVYYNPSSNAGDEVEFLKLDPNLNNLDAEDFASF
ncbi:MAG: calcium-binding protein [Cyanobacteriota bacterium]|nr:calcium-binding protein [Cyanobacteriota bacterium]